MASERERVELTASELFESAVAGLMRHCCALRDRRTPRRGAEHYDGWGIDIEGACGERAVAKALNRYWQGAGTFRGGDVGALQVRTRSQHDYDLPIGTTDADADVFVLVTGRAPSFRVRGWVYGYEGKLAEYWGDPTGFGAAYYVPASALHDLDLLRRLL